MRKAIIMLTLAIAGVHLHAQHLGHNGAKFEQNLNAYTIPMVVDGVEPGQAYCWRFRADKYTTAVPDSMLSRAVALHQAFVDSGKHLEIIYTINTRGLNADENTYGLRYLTERGVDVIAVECGNEEYSWYEMNFQAYLQACEPSIAAIQREYPGMPITLFAAPRPADSQILGGRSDHQMWNSQLAAWIFTQPMSIAISWHIYLNEREAPVMKSLPQEVVFSPDQYYPDLDTYYDTLIHQGLRGMSLYAATKQYTDEKFPGRAIYITESGPYINTGPLQNAWGYQALEWQMWCTQANQWEALLKHNGLTTENPGYISERKPVDDQGQPGYIRRLSYHTHKLYRQAGELQPWSQQINSGGIFHTWYLNAEHSDLNIMPFLGDSIVLDSIRIHCIQGSSYYSGSGATEWMGRQGSTAGMEISGSITIDGGLAPGISYGWAEVYTHKIAAQQPCHRPWWCRFLPKRLKCNCNKLTI